MPARSKTAKRKSPKKSPRRKSAWDLHLAKTWASLKRSDKNASFKEAMFLASSTYNGCALKKSSPRKSPKKSPARSPRRYGCPDY